MALSQFTPVIHKINEGNHMDIRFGNGAALSLPVAVRRGDAQYDAMFIYDKPKEGEASSPRPFAWVMLEAATGQVAQLCRCDLVDFIPPGRHPPGSPLPMNAPKAMHGKRAGALREKLLAAYEELRGFVFDENLTRQQAAAIADYKDNFTKLTYPSHYAFYHALSPAFFHWLRMPLPKESLMNPGEPLNDMQKDGYQLLILENLQQLVRQFQEKISVDAHKQRLFDDVHRELQDYKNDMLGALTLSLERDVIQLIDGVSKTLETFRGREGTPENYRKLLSMMEGVETDLCDLLYRHGVEPFICAGVDVSRQKIVQTLPVDERELDKTIAARLGRGWEKDGKVIRPERISVYVYSAAAKGGRDGKGE